MEYYKRQLSEGKYICDGARSINHDTQFQNYLEKYFLFRKAYCRLNIAYKPKIGGIVKFLYYFRKPLKAFDSVGIIHPINAILKMEEISRCTK